MSERLNIGCGPVVAHGWMNVDHSTEWEALGAWHGDPLDGLQWDDHTFDGAVAHHVLQMVAWPDLVPWLSEVRRVLKRAAWLRITVPDIERAFAALERQRIAWFPIDDEHEQSIDGKFCMYVSQAGATRSVFTSTWLHELLARAGFVVSHTCATGGYTAGADWLLALDSRLDESIIVEAQA